MTQDERDLHELINTVSDLKSEIYNLKQRIRTLENKAQREEDRRGYEKQGDRYAGEHPRSCACNRCLSKW